MSVHSGSEEEEIGMEFYAVPAVEGLVEGGGRASKGQHRKFGPKIPIFSDLLAREATRAHGHTCS